jgi:endonuclease III
MDLVQLLEEKGQLYSEELRIDVTQEPFKWFLAAFLFGARISVKIAKQTYKAYETEELINPKQLAKVSHRFLVKLHGRAGYTRYDNVTADYVKGIAQRLLTKYDGDIRRLDKISKNPQDLEEQLQKFRGVGPVTTNIFLRELRGIWQNADPDLTEIERRATQNLNFFNNKKCSLVQLKQFWQENRITGYDFRHLEAALIRLGLTLRRRKT